MKLNAKSANKQDTCDTSDVNVYLAELRATKLLYDAISSSVAVIPTGELDSYWSLFVDGDGKYMMNINKQDICYNIIS